MTAAEPPSSPDDRVFAELYPGLRRFAAVVASPGTDPDDLVQDALVRVLRRGGLGRLEHPAAYLRQAILRLAMDDRRSFGRRMRAIGRLGSAGPSASSYPSELGDLDQLESVDRAILYLGDVEGIPQADIADQLGLTHQAVRTRASRARRQLRRVIEEEES
ncbi:MAG: sigma-70 family RNA polymerase sigma factor [Actinomycetota bacterium]